MQLMRAEQELPDKHKLTQRLAPPPSPYAPSGSQDLTMERGSKSSEQQNSVYGVRGAGAKTIDGEAITTMSNIDAAIPDTPNERLRNLLDEAAALAHGTDDYLMKCTSPPSEAAKALEAKTFEADWKTLFKNGETMFEFSSRCVV